MIRIITPQFIYCILIFFSVGKICSQDTIVFVNGTKHAAKIIEITEKKVKYKNPKDTLGPTYIILRRDVERFIRAQGCFEIEDKGYENCVKDPNYYVIKNENFTRHILSFDIARLFVRNVKLTYDYVVRNRRLGLGVYFERGMDNWDDKEVYAHLKQFSGGFYKINTYGADLKIYPFAHKKIVYWLAIGIETGNYGNMVMEQKNMPGVNVTHIITNNYSVTTTSNYWYGYTGNINFYKELYAGGFFTNGFIYRPVKHFVLQGYFSFGVNAIQLKEEHNKVVSLPSAAIGLKTGYAF